MNISRILRLAMASAVMIGATAGAHATTCISQICDLGLTTVHNATPPVPSGAGSTLGNHAPYDSALSDYAQVTVGDSLTFAGGYTGSGAFNTVWYFTTLLPNVFLDGASFSTQSISSFSGFLYDSANNVVGPLGGFVPGTTYFMIPLTSVGTYHFVVSGTFPVAGAGAPHWSFNGNIVPLPAAAWLLLSGVAGLGAMARRRKVAAET